ncbi:hypothetical protein GCM10028815_19470 [Mariniluteicoccus flavus]
MRRSSRHPGVRWCGRPDQSAEHQTEEDPMCKPVECPQCHKTTWQGCGEHVDQVKAQVRPEDWCTCPRD